MKGSEPSSYPMGNTLEQEPHTRKRISPLFVCALVLAVICIAFATYTGFYYHAGATARQAATSDASLQVHDYGGTITFGDPDGAKAGFILYPGAKVEPVAYAPLVRAIAEQGYYCVIVEPPFNLAMFDPDAAQKEIGSHPEISSWYVGGHSLGGAMMTYWASVNSDRAKGLVFLASYPAADLSGTDLATLSIRGSADGVLNMERYTAARSKLPADAEELVIEGGNHAGFGDYGAQDGDGRATIAQEDQWQRTAEAIVAFMEDNG